MAGCNCNRKGVRPQKKPAAAPKTTKKPAAAPKSGPAKSRGKKGGTPTVVEDITGGEQAAPKLEAVLPTGYTGDPKAFVNFVNTLAKNLQKSLDNLETLEQHIGGRLPSVRGGDGMSDDELKVAGSLMDLGDRYISTDGKFIRDSKDATASLLWNDGIARLTSQLPEKERIIKTLMFMMYIITIIVSLLEGGNALIRSDVASATASFRQDSVLLGTEPLARIVFAISPATASMLGYTVNPLHAAHEKQIAMAWTFLCTFAVTRAYGMTSDQTKNNIRTIIAYTKPMIALIANTGNVDEYVAAQVLQADAFLSDVVKANKAGLHSNEDPSNSGNNEKEHSKTRRK